MRVERKKKTNMSRSEFLHYFKQKKPASETSHENEITITKMFTFSTYEISNAELILGEEEIQKSVKRSAKCQKSIPEKFKRGIYVNSFGSDSAIKRFRSNDDKYSFNRTKANLLKNEFKNTADKDLIFKKAGRPTLLDDNLIKRVKGISIRTRAAGCVINSKQIQHPTLQK